MNINSTNPIHQETEMVVPTNAEFNRSLKVMGMLIETGQLKIRSFAWLRCALDPFTDTVIPDLNGLPDNTSGGSVVLPVTQEIQISRPAGFVGATWSFRIDTRPSISGYSEDSVAVFNNDLVYSAAVGATSYPVHIDFADGVADFTLASTVNSTGLEVPTGSYNSPTRVIGLGIEGFDTTADIYKQGTLTACLIPQATHKTHSVYITEGGTGRGNADAVTLIAAPTNQAQMNLSPNVREWAAKDGFYSVVPINGFGESDTSAQVVGVVRMGNPVTIGNFTARSGCYFNQVVGGNRPDSRIIKYNAGFCPAQQTTIMVRGLNNLSTYTVRARWFLEIFPTTGDNAILPLATPSPGVDPLALELYYRVIAKMPPAVTFNENDTGEWFKTILSGLADVAANGLMAVPHPLAQAGGATIRAIRNMFSDEAPKKKEKPAKIKVPAIEQKAALQSRRPPVRAPARPPATKTLAAKKR